MHVHSAKRDSVYDDSNAHWGLGQNHIHPVIFWADRHGVWYIFVCANHCAKK